MKVEDLSKAMGIKEELRILQEQYKVVGNANNGGLRITIQSAYQDDDFVGAIREHVLAELNRRIEEKMQNLSELGVTFTPLFTIDNHYQIWVGGVKSSTPFAF